MSRFNIVLAIFVTMLEIAPRLALASPNDTEVNEYLQSELQHIATLNERSDVAGTRLYISGSPVINSAIIWQADGKQRYPATAQVLHVMDQPVISAQKPHGRHGVLSYLGSCPPGCSSTGEEQRTAGSEPPSRAC